MKNLLLIFTTLSSIHITLSDVIEMSHYVGTLVYGQPSYIRIHCIDDCKLEKVEATYNDGGKLNVIGSYGNEETKSEFCKGMSVGGTAATCVISKNTGLSNVIIMLFAYTRTTYNVHLNVTGSNLFGIGDPIILKHSFGSISRYTSAYLLIDCKGDCHLGKVDVTFRNGGKVEVIGQYGEPRKRFCEGLHLNDAATTCEVMKKTGPSDVLIRILAHQTSNNLEVAVTGFYLSSMRLLPSLVTTIGNLDENYHALCNVKCGDEKNACNLIEVIATFKEKGDVDLYGYYDENIPFCDGEDRKTGFQNCPLRIETGLINAQVIVKGYNTSENVKLIVTGYNLNSVEHTTTVHG